MCACPFLCTPFIWRSALRAHMFFPGESGNRAVQVGRVLVLGVYSGCVSHKLSCVAGTVATLMTRKTMTTTLILRRPAHV